MRDFSGHNALISGAKQWVLQLLQHCVFISHLHNCVLHRTQDGPFRHPLLN